MILLFCLTIVVQNHLSLFKFVKRKTDYCCDNFRARECQPEEIKSDLSKNNTERNEQYNRSQNRKHRAFES